MLLNHLLAHLQHLVSLEDLGHELCAQGLNQTDGLWISGLQDLELGFVLSSGGVLFILI